MDSTAEIETAAPGLHRTLKLHHLILYGITIIQPTAPMSIYGVVSNAARGHVVTTILIAMFAMLFTSVSYGRMARVYPSAGSAYSYVGKEIHPLAGYVVGWSMLMNYMLNSIICTIWCSAAAQNIVLRFPMRHGPLRLSSCSRGSICEGCKPQAA
jgi:amino acid transporter